MWSECLLASLMLEAIAANNWSILLWCTLMQTREAAALDSQSRRIARSMGCSFANFTLRRLRSLGEDAAKLHAKGLAWISAESTNAGT
jgi:hypothetical protein